MSDEKELTFFDNLENRNKILKDFDIGKRKINLICCLITSFQSLEQMDQKVKNKNKNKK